MTREEMITHVAGIIGAVDATAYYETTSPPRGRMYLDYGVEFDEASVKEAATEIVDWIEKQVIPSKPV